MNDTTNTKTLFQEQLESGTARIPAKCQPQPLLPSGPSWRNDQISGHETWQLCYSFKKLLNLDIACNQQTQSHRAMLLVVLQRKPFAFKLFFCLAKAGFFTFSSKTHSIVSTSNLCRNIQRPNNQLNQ